MAVKETASDRGFTGLRPDLMAESSRPWHPSLAGRFITTAAIFGIMATHYTGRAMVQMVNFRRPAARRLPQKDHTWNY